MITIIDSYTEHLLNAESKPGEKIGTLPRGIARDEWLNTLNVLIRETFPEMTGFTEADYRSGKALLQLVKKYCLGDKCFAGIKKGKSLADYLEATKAMLEEELNRMNSVNAGVLLTLDHEKTFTILSNAMQLLTTVMEAKEKAKTSAAQNNQPVILGVKLPFGVPGQQAQEVEFARESTEIGDVIGYIDETWEITKDYQKAKASLKFQGDTIVEWMEFKYLRMILEVTKMRLDEIGVF